MNKIKALIFDFDGVIADSVDVKTKAFAAIYSQYGNAVVQKVIEHHEANGGISRFEKFRLYHKDFVGEAIDDEQIDKLARQFSDLVLQKIVEAPYVKGAYEYLSTNYRRFNFFISTGTPTDEIKIILERRKLSPYFKEVYGSPEKKEDHVREIIYKNHFSKNEVIFIGDAITDRDAAKRNGIVFIGRFTSTEAIKKEKYLFDNFIELESIVNVLNQSESYW